ncbi:MAG: PEFG-CTERM sorting domain-containing protein [Nitrosopumilaceae archaeon]
MLIKSTFGLLVLLLIPFFTIIDVHGQSEFDTIEMGLPAPSITMTPTSGGPGTEVEILVTAMPALPDDIDPRIEFFIYMPFLESIGGNIPQTCDGDGCFALYSFDEVNSNKFAPKTISFTLFSTTNPKPTVEAGGWNSVCDLKINGVTTERYGNTCIDQDQPLGDYEIKFGWGIQTSQLYDVRETLNFTVTEKKFVEEERQLDEDELAMLQYEEGLISESEFEQKLTELGYDDDKIRQAKALIGKLEHQEGFKTPLKGPIEVQGTDYEITYTISGGVINKVSPDQEAESLIITVDSISNGTLFIQLPRDVIDAKFGDDDDDFFVLIDGLETGYDETKSVNDRTLTIQFPAGTEEIEIIGTFVVPEFGTIVLMILLVSVSSVIVLSRTKYSLMKI